MPKFRKKPVEIEARHMPHPVDHYHASEYRHAVTSLAEWCGGAVVDIDMWESGHAPLGVNIETLEGTMSAGLGDWIIRGVQGEFYPCKPEIFTATYDPV